MTPFEVTIDTIFNAVKSTPRGPIPYNIGHYANHNISPGGILEDLSYGVHNSMLTTISYRGYIFS